VYVGGSFTVCGPDNRYGASLATTTGVPDLAFLNPNGQVNAAIPDGAGGWFIGGAFTEVGGQARVRLARLNADGTLHPWNPACNGTVNALDLEGGTLYIGGSFNQVGGQARRNVAAVDPNTATVLALGGPQTQAPVGALNALDAVGSTVYVGGSFTVCGPDIPSGASLNATTGVPDLAFLNPNGAVTAAIPDGAGGWFIGGTFTQVGGQARERLARLNADGTLHPWNPNANGTVLALAVSGSTVYAGGAFTSIGGQTRNGIAALDASTGVATAWDPNANGTVYSLAVSGSTVYTGGRSPPSAGRRVTGSRPWMPARAWPRHGTPMPVARSFPWP
jgi:hypothetical protein